MQIERDLDAFVGSAANKNTPQYSSNACLGNRNPNLIHQRERNIGFLEEPETLGKKAGCNVPREVVIRQFRQDMDPLTTPDIKTN